MSCGIGAEGVTEPLEIIKLHCFPAAEYPHAESGTREAAQARETELWFFQPAEPS